MRLSTFSALRRDLEHVQTIKYSNIYVVHIIARLHVYQHKIRGACELDMCSSCARTSTVHVLIVTLKFVSGSMYVNIYSYT